MPLNPKLLVAATVVVICLEGAYIAYRALPPSVAPEPEAAASYSAAGIDNDFFTSGIRIINGGETAEPMPPALGQVAQATAAGTPVAQVPPALTATPAPIAPAPVPVAATPAAPAAPAVDETALRYFARQGDERRLNAEIARLKALYPDWSPPDNLNSAAPIADPVLDQMWKLYGDGQYAAVRAAIADRIGRDPKWAPPADLLTRLAVGESRERLVNASNARQWNTVVSIAAATPSLLTCADVDVLWRLAEAFGVTSRTSCSRDVDLYILNNCTNPRERLATVQKAMAVLDDAELDDLLKLERKGPDGEGEFEPIKGDIARRRLAAAARDPKLTVDPADIAMVEQLAREGAKADDPLLLGSYWFAHGDPAKAVDWFTMAKSRADTAEIARGYAYTLNALKRPADAEEAAYKWRDAGGDNKNAYLIVATSLLAVDPPVKLLPDVMKRIAATIADAKYGPGAQELGWYAYKIGQTAIAARWFGMAEALMPEDEPTAYGLALAYDRLKDRAGFAKVLRAWGRRSPRIADLANPPNRRKTAVAAQRSALPAPDGAMAEPTVQPAAPVGVDEAAPVEPVASAEPAQPTYSEAQPVAPVRRAAAKAAAPATTQGTVRRQSGCTGNVRPEQLSAMSALNRGWCLLNLNRPIEAADAFEAALRSGSGQISQDAAYGKTLAYLRAGLTGSAAASAAETPQSGQRGIELKAEILAQRAIASYNDDRYVETLLVLDERAEIAPEQNDLLMMRGWCYFHLRRYPEAKRIWVAVSGTGSRDAQRALAVLNDATKVK